MMTMNKLLYLLLLFTFSTSEIFSQSSNAALKDKVICIDPGHGGTSATDHYRVGPTGEREEWINLRVGLLLQKMLLEKGAKVLITRTDDQFVTLPDRAKLANDNKADLFISIHHNATADSSVNFPIIYFHGNKSENKASVSFGKELALKMLKYLHHKNSPVSLVSDFTIFPDAGASVLRNTYGIPGILAEASFFTNKEEENRLKQENHNRNEAKAYLEAIEGFFSKTIDPIEKQNSKVPQIPAFKVFQEAERMTPIAKNWKKDYQDAKNVLAETDTISLKKAYELFSRSARSFPDSYVAALCHKNRALILTKLNRTKEAEQEAQRFKEYYVEM